MESFRSTDRDTGQFDRVLAVELTAIIAAEPPLCR